MQNTCVQTLERCKLGKLTLKNIKDVSSILTDIDSLLRTKANPISLSTVFKRSYNKTSNVRKVEVVDQLRKELCIVADETFEKRLILFKLKSKIPDFERGKRKIWR